MPDKVQPAVGEMPGMTDDPRTGPPGSMIAVDEDSSFSHHSLLTLFIFIWGGNFVLAEVALREMDPISFSVARFVIGGVALLAILYAQCYIEARKHGGSLQLFPKLEKKDWPRLLLVSLIGATLAPWLGIEGLGLTHGARASLWLALGPAISAGMGYLLHTERIGRMGMVGLLLAGIGTFGLAIDGLAPERAYWFGDLLLFLAIVLAAGELHLIKPLAIRYGATSMVTARTIIGGGLYMLVAAPSLVEQTWLVLGIWTWIAIVLGGGIGVGIGQWVKVRALKTLGPTRVVLYGNLVPLAALLLAWLTIGTIPTLLELSAGVLIILGAVLLQVVDAPRRLTHPAHPNTQPAST